MNRLASEKSPYLLHHAGNPVDWYPWGPEAFQKAETQNKPIILSIGYSTCHWCHVMERESFENSEIARLMNDSFVSIKVDREERPDLDQIYMAAVTSMTGHGGWPLTVFLTPEKKPFYGGTYFPPYAKWGSPGFAEILRSIHHTWQSEPDRVVASSVEITEHLKQRFAVKTQQGKLSQIQLDQMYHRLKSQYDSVNGGFSQAPKFPMGHILSLLLRYWRRTGQQPALDMTLQTLQAMANGGIYDQLGGGFHRYSTDQFWHVPHFEKMLYDQALLVKSYLEAYQITGNEFFAQIARDVLDYVLREMTDSSGGFYSAQDADSLDEQSSEKKEGVFYIWAWDEIKAAFPEQSLPIIAYYFGIEKEGNAKEDPHGEFVGKNILSVAHSIEETAKHFQWETAKVAKVVRDAKATMFKMRQQRPAVHCDDKIMADWNGLMISSFAFASQVLKDKRYAVAAQQASDFILMTLTDNAGRLLHRYRDGHAGILGSLEDYAFFISGLLDLYEATLEFKYYQKAKAMADDMIEYFEDREHGGFFMTGRDAESLIVRCKETYDGALPSGNSMAIMVLLRLYHLSSDDKYQSKAHQALDCFADTVSPHPEAYCVLLAALDFFLGPVDELVLCGNHPDLEFQKMHQRTFAEYRPNKIIASHPYPLKQEEDPVKAMPILKGRLDLNGSFVSGYLCRDAACLRPAVTYHDWDEILKNNEPSLRTAQ